MPLELRPGVAVGIPCRHCAKSLIRFTVAEGNHSLACARCAGATDVHVYGDKGEWRIKSWPGKAKVTR